MKKGKSTSKMTKDEWLQSRRRGIGGSDVGAICGLNKYKSPFQVYLDKLGLLPKQEQSEKAYWGNTLEELVALEFSKRTGKKIRKENKILIHSEYYFMIANIDRAIVGEKAILECKTTSEYNKQEWEGEKVPDVYMLQCQHYLAVTGFDKCYIACLIGGQNFVYKEILRNEELIKSIIELEKQFWNENVVKKVPPRIDGLETTKKALLGLYPFSENEILLNDKSLIKIKKLEELKEKESKLKEEITAIENSLKEELGTNEAGTVGEYKVIWKSYKTNRLDTKALKSEEEEIYKKYLKQSENRKFSITKIK